MAIYILMNVVYASMVTEAKDINVHSKSQVENKQTTTLQK